MTQLARQAVYSEADPELNRRLVQLEENVARALQQAALQQAKAWDVVDVRQDYQASDGEFVLVDASVQAVSIILPPARRGAVVRVARSKGVNTVTVYPLPGGLIGSSTTASVANDWLEFVGDGEGWWRNA